MYDWSRIILLSVWVSGARPGVKPISPLIPKDHEKATWFRRKKMIKYDIGAKLCILDIYQRKICSERFIHTDQSNKMNLWSLIFVQDPTVTQTYSFHAIHSVHSSIGMNKSFRTELPLMVFGLKEIKYYSNASVQNSRLIFWIFFFHFVKIIECSYFTQPYTCHYTYHLFYMIILCRLCLPEKHKPHCEYN
jgi:hypothetical protein